MILPSQAFASRAAIHRLGRGIARIRTSSSSPVGTERMRPVTPSATSWTWWICVVQPPRWMAMRADLVSREPTDAEDAEVPGVYLVEVDAEIPEADRASAALDAFHGGLAVGTLDDFAFRTFDAGGREIVQGNSEP